MAALAAVHYFFQAKKALVGDVAPVGEHPILLIHPLRTILLIVIKSIEVFVIVEMTGLADHVLAVLGGRVQSEP